MVKTSINRILYDQTYMHKDNKAKGRPQHRTQNNTIAKYFQPIQAGAPRRREGQAQNRTSSKVQSRKINTSPTEETDNSDRIRASTKVKGPQGK